MEACMAIRIENLSRIFETAEGELRALDGVSLTIGDGEFVAIVGKSGSGKTTLLNLIAGLDKSTGGKIILDGTDITALSSASLAKLRRKKIGVIYQFYNLISELNIRDNIALPIELDGGKLNEERLKETTKAVGLDGRENDYPSMLSGGQQQRVAIARALYQSPSVLLADEPTGNLDAENSREIMRQLTELNENNGITLIVVTHSDEIAKMARRVITLEKGKITEDKRIV